ncbi:MAG: hypothetical protein IT458_09890 [Planctomycetes bacterium]|nr:hypothetical protein [Planctomycetota bacterium]
MSDKKPMTLGERWRRDQLRGVDDQSLASALEVVRSVRQVRVQPGGIHAELEGAMGSIQEVHLHVPTLPVKVWPQVARGMRRAASMMEALGQGRVPRSFDRLVARIAKESIYPDRRRVSAACSCAAVDTPCRHVIALHELFARRLDTKPWELLILRGVNLHELLAKARAPVSEDALPTLALGAHEEPILHPDCEDGDLDKGLAPEQIRCLLGLVAPALADEAAEALRAFEDSVRAVAGA